MICQYSFSGNSEQYVHLGRGHPRQILIIPPFFEEMNRTRWLMLTAMRTLDEARIGTILPDLPGQNESLVTDETISLSLWHAALERLAAQSGVAIDMICAFRSGAMLDDAFPCPRHWRLAPEDGPGLLRQLIRTRLAADREAGLSGSTELLLANARQESTEFAGTCLSPVFINDLENAKLTVHEQVRTVQLDGNAAQADAYISGKPLWRQSEPDEDQWLAQQIAGDIAAWVHR
ncbi:hypothetical protein [Rhizorhapis sp. SPR117]|uniref:hypothetical protein n=1 Tax=Rhizorhapis sp. SPR117 TaxID=2912611 RepID=UPI001F3C7914|nr:hypothetical protein [Rhizorhapis sp. SPR117]